MDLCVSKPWMGWFQLSQLCLCPSRKQCLRYGGPRTAQCRHNTTVFAIGISYTVFFLEDKTERLCQQTLVDLSQHCKMSVNR